MFLSWQYICQVVHVKLEITVKAVREWGTACPLNCPEGKYFQFPAMFYLSFPLKYTNEDITAFSWIMCTSPLDFGFVFQATEHLQKAMEGHPGTVAEALAVGERMLERHSPPRERKAAKTAKSDGAADARYMHVFRVVAPFTTLW